jgi:hypothetical protein
MSVLQTNPRRFARIAGAFYLLTFVFGIAALTTAGDTRLAANLIAAVVYYVVTVMLYQLYKPVSPTGSLVTALFSFAALTIGVLSDFGVVRFPLNTLVLFGVYCLGLGGLTLKATFLPKAIGVLLIVAGVGVRDGAGDARRRGADVVAVGRRRRSRAVACSVDQEQGVTE